MSEIDDLAAFAVLLEVGSFTHAAERLGCSKGQLSKRIRGLEQGLGVTLLQRTTRKLTLTSAGSTLLPEAQALLVQAQRARQSLARLNEDLSGTVRLTVPVSLVSGRLCARGSAKIPPCRAAPCIRTGCGAACARLVASISVTNRAGFMGYLQDERSADRATGRRCAARTAAQPWELL